MNKKIYFGAGCFWGVQTVFDAVAEVTRTRVGYMGGKTSNPSYKEVCTDKTGHAEVVLVEYKETGNFEVLKKLLDVFFLNHDPTTLNRQGVDSGTQYRSAIFCAQDEFEVCKNKINEHQKNHQDKIVTEIVSNPTEFFEAEEYHQDYFKKNPGSCHI